MALKKRPNPDLMATPPPERPLAPLTSVRVPDPRVDALPEGGARCLSLELIDAKPLLFHFHQ